MRPGSGKPATSASAVGVAVRSGRGGGSSGSCCTRASARFSIAGESYGIRVAPETTSLSLRDGEIRGASTAGILLPEGLSIRKVIVVPGKLVNIVAN